MTTIVMTGFANVSVMHNVVVKANQGRASVHINDTATQKNIGRIMHTNGQAAIADKARLKSACALRVLSDIQ